MTMTKRSSHMPMLIMMETKSSLGMFWRTLEDHSDCGIRILHTINITKENAYGPVVRFLYMNSSYGLPLYQDMKASIMYP